MIRGVAPGPRRAAFAAFAREIAQAPAFANGRVFKDFKLYDGRESVADPTVDAMPCARLRYLAGEVARLATVGPAISSRYAPTVLVEAWVVGTDQGDLADLGDLIEDALRPADPAARAGVAARLAAVGIVDWQLARDLAPPDPASFDAGSIRATAEYRLTLDLTT